MTPHPLTRATVGAAATLAALLPLAACGPGPGEPSASSPPRSAAPSDEAPSTNSTGYADGTYTARGYYGGAPSYMTFTVTLEDGVISEVSSELMPENNDTSRGYQERFAEALPEEVVGRSVDEVEVGRLAGSSSCGDGFNDALAQIRDEAEADT